MRTSGTRKFGLFLAISLALTMVLHAQHPESDEAWSALAKAKNEMETVYQYLLEASGQNEFAKDAYKKSQRAWKNYCREEANATEIATHGISGGHPASRLYARTSTALTRERTVCLINHLKILYERNKSDLQTAGQAEQIRQMLDKVKKFE